MRKLSLIVALVSLVVGAVAGQANRAPRPGNVEIHRVSTAPSDLATLIATPERTAKRHF